MYSFQINSFGAAIFLAALLMGALGVFVIAPVALIEYSWNLAASHLVQIPSISPWQALLVYLALATIIYLSGWIKIEIKTGSLE